MIERVELLKVSRLVSCTKVCMPLMGNGPMSGGVAKWLNFRLHWAKRVSYKCELLRNLRSNLCDIIKYLETEIKLKKVSQPLVLCTILSTQTVQTNKNKYFQMVFCSVKKCFLGPLDGYKQNYFYFEGFKLPDNLTA